MKATRIAAAAAAGAGIAALVISAAPAGATAQSARITVPAAATANPGVITVQVTVDGVGVATATCPASHPHAVSGGGSVANPIGNGVGQPAAMAASVPGGQHYNAAGLLADPTEWSVIAVDTAAEPGPGGVVSWVTAYVNCVA
jgi:hypothetical protein